MITELVQDFGRTLIYLIFSEILSAAVLGADPHTARCRSERLEGATQSPAGVQDPPPCRRGTSKDTAEIDLGAIQKRVRQGPEVALTGGAGFSETSPLLKVDRQSLGVRAEAHARRAQSRIGLRKGAMTGQIIGEWRRRTASLPRSFRQTIRRLRFSLLCLGLRGVLLANLVGFPGQPIRAQWRANVVKEV